MKRKTQHIKELIKDGKSVFSATFTFLIKNYDSEFERLNNLIDHAANSNPGFLGKEKWISTEDDKRSVTYYWESLEALKIFSKHPAHQKAKQNYQEWYSGYEVIISEVLKFKSDEEIGLMSA